MTPKYRVWCEFTIEGEKHCEMAGPENWLLLSQTGKLMCHSPDGSFDPNVAQKYDKLVVEFWTGLLDKDGKKELYAGDICKCHMFYQSGGEETEHEFTGTIVWNDDYCGFVLQETESIWYEFGQMSDDGIEKIGTIHENPELIE